jgi:hypothetical protein
MLMSCIGNVVSPGVELLIGDIAPIVLRNAKLLIFDATHIALHFIL